VYSSRPSFSYSHSSSSLLSSLHDTNINPPHSCGHIFCKTCLATLSPSSCPLCRKPFSLDKVKRLIVDRISPSDPSLGPSRNGAAGGGGNGLLDESTTLLEQIALVSGEDTPIEQAMQVLGGAKQWLDVQPANPNTVSHTHIHGFFRCSCGDICIYPIAFHRNMPRTMNNQLNSSTHPAPSPKSSRLRPLAVQRPPSRTRQDPERLQNLTAPLQEEDPGMGPG
jgi:hypothetical protein